MPRCSKYQSLGSDSVLVETVFSDDTLGFNKIFIQQVGMVHSDRLQLMVHSMPIICK